MKLCTKCLIEKEFEKFYRKGNWCKDCWCEYSRQNYRKNPNLDKRRAQVKKYQKQNPEALLISQAKHRAKKLNLKFDIDKSDIFIPDICPVLGIKLNRKVEGIQTDNSPSLDRIIPKLGYVKGNIKIISWRANRIKNDSTLEEIEAIARYVKNQSVV
jgi:hypothetical protein